MLYREWRQLVMYAKKWFKKGLYSNELCDFLNSGELRPEDWKIINTPSNRGKSSAEFWIEIVYLAEKEIIEIKTK